MIRAQNLAVIGTSLLAAMTNAGAVTVLGLAAFLLPGVVGAALFGSFLAVRRKSAAALILGGVLILGPRGRARKRTYPGRGKVTAGPQLQRRCSGEPKEARRYDSDGYGRQDQRVRSA